jgi:hypothetical protein
MDIEKETRTALPRSYFKLLEPYQTPASLQPYLYHVSCPRVSLPARAQLPVPTLRWCKRDPEAPYTAVCVLSLSSGILEQYHSQGILRIPHNNVDRALVCAIKRSSVKLKSFNASGLGYYGPSSQVNIEWLSLEFFPILREEINMLYLI